MSEKLLFSIIKSLTLMMFYNPINCLCKGNWIFSTLGPKNLSTRSSKMDVNLDQLRTYTTIKSPLQVQRLQEETIEEYLDH
jgi:hypothetical protein